MTTKTVQMCEPQESVDHYTSFRSQPEQKFATDRLIEYENQHFYGFQTCKGTISEIC